MYLSTLARFYLNYTRLGPKEPVTYYVLLHVFRVAIRPDITVKVDWALKSNYLSILGEDLILSLI